MIAYCHDIIAAGLSYVIAIYLRIGATTYELAPDFVIQGAITMTLISVVVFRISGLYRGVWRYASMNDLIAITRAVTITMLVFIVIMFAWSRMDDLPRSVPFINWFILMAMLGGPRFMYRFWKDRRIDLSMPSNLHRIPVLLIGAADGADQFLRGLRQGGDISYRVAGILSENSTSVGRTIHGVNVLGTIDDLESVTKKLKVIGGAPQKLILTKDDITGATVRDLLDRAAKLGMSLARMPKLTDFRDPTGDNLGDDLKIRPVAIEDLLGRPQTPLDRGAMEALVKDRRVMITGAGGSIGSELSRQIAAFGPKSLRLVESSEFALYTIDREISVKHPDLARVAVIADVRDRERVMDIFEDGQPEVVFHAAALKHVPLVESNPAEGVLTNIGGTVNVADACIAHGVSTMVQISTDKAVNPTSVMGATKRAAEMYCQAFDLDKEAVGQCRFVTVRFGNVLGSTGSVVPLFQSQLEQGGPLTVTDPAMTRYFMTIREAVELVLEAAAIGQHDTNTDGRIFVLDMGEPVKIVDLARQMIRLSGKEPDRDISIVFTGARPGEKLFEEVLHGDETTVKTAHAGLLLAAPRVTERAELQKQFDQLFTTARNGEMADVKKRLQTLIPEYTTET